MKPLSASQAVLPSFERMRGFLFRAFDWGTYLKLAAVACVTEGFWVAFNLSAAHASRADEARFPPSGLSPAVIAWIIFFVIAGGGLGLLFYYVVIRLRFAFFHCLLRRANEIGPGWELYSAQAMRLFLGSLLVWLSIAGMVLLVIGGLAVTVFSVATLRTQDNKLDPGVFFILFYPCLGFALFVAVLAVAAEVLLHDFVLPHMAMEDATFREAWTAAWTRVLAEKESFFSYLIVRMLAPLLALVALLIVSVLPLLAVHWVLATSATGFHDMLEDATGVGAFFRILMEIVFTAIGIGASLLAVYSLTGPVATWIRCYAILFYSGRYKALGEALNATAAMETQDGTGRACIA